MKKDNKIKLLIILVFVVAIVAIAVLFPNGSEKRFNSILKEYDKEYSQRLKEYENENVLRCYDLGENMGFVAVGQGYADVIVVFAEFGTERVENVEILYHNETEDHGDLVVEQWFLQRLYLPYDKVFETVRGQKESANEIIAITSATITSDAVVMAINECTYIMEEIRK